MQEYKHKPELDKKLDWSLMPFEQLEDVLAVLMHGAKKYNRFNWQLCDDRNIHTAAAMRHLVTYMKGESLDSETGKSHLAHLICNALFCMYFDDKEKSKETKND